MTYWTLEHASDLFIELLSERYRCTVEGGKDDYVVILMRRTTRPERSRIVYAGPLEGRATMHPQSVGRAALNALAREYPPHTLPYVVHAVAGVHGAWCLEGCTLMVLEDGSSAEASAETEAEAS